MGINLGATRSVLAISRNKEVQIVPFDNSSSGELWTESVVSFDSENPLFGKAAISRLKNKADYVISDAKILYDFDYQLDTSNQLIPPFDYISEGGEQIRSQSMTTQGLKKFSIAYINKIFLEKMMKAASDYQSQFNNNGLVKKAVLTVPEYFRFAGFSSPVIFNIFEGAGLADIEIVDVIEEAHADLLYYLSNEKYSILIKLGMKIAVFNIGGTKCISKVYEVSEYKDKKYMNCIGELHMSCIDKHSERIIDNIITEKLEELIPEDLRSELKPRILEAAKKIKNELSIIEKTTINLQDICTQLSNNVDFTREWFEQELKTIFNNDKLCYYKFKKYPLPAQKHLRCKLEIDSKLYPPLMDVNVVFLAGGICRIPFIQKWIKDIFPNAEIKIDSQLEIITATGAVIHALQVLDGEIEPYVVDVEHPTPNSVVENSGKAEINTYVVKPEKVIQGSQFEAKSMEQAILELTTLDRSIPMIMNINDNTTFSGGQIMELIKNSGKYKKPVHIAVIEKEPEYYMTLKVKYSVDDWILMFTTNNEVKLCWHTKYVNGNMHWYLFDVKHHEYTGRINFQYVEDVFHLKMDQVHVVFEDSREKIDSLYGSQLYEFGFKSVNFICLAHDRDYIESVYVFFDPEIASLVTITQPYAVEDSYPNYIIRDWSYIHIPKLVKEYESRTDIMGIDLGATKSVLAVSRNNKIEIVPFDPSAPENLWTESVVFFDNETPVIGNEAKTMFKTKPDSIIFDIKLISDCQHRWNKRKQLTWPFHCDFREYGEPSFILTTSKGPKKFSLVDINQIFLKQMSKAASEYQEKHNNGRSKKKAVITVPRYYCTYWINLTSLIDSSIKAATLADIEVIDVIEETHADLLYYLSNEKYCRMIKPEMKIGIIDIGGGHCYCRVYQISQYKNKEYATCIGEVFVGAKSRYCGRDIDDIIVEELENSIPGELKKNMKLRILRAAQEIKHRLSSEEEIEYNLSNIHSELETTIEFTKKWFEEKLNSQFNNGKTSYLKYPHYPLPTETKLRHYIDIEDRLPPPFDDVNIVFLAGGTCRIPFIQEWVRKIFPKAEIIMEKEVETITATGAAIHALQVLSKEFKPYVEVIQNITACSIIKYAYEYEIDVYDNKIKQVFTSSESANKSIYKIIDELITSYPKKPGIIVLVNDSDLAQSESENFSKEDFEKYGGVVHLATKKELNFDECLKLKVEYAIGDWILFFSEEYWIGLYEYTGTDGRIMKWKYLDIRYTLTEQYNFKYIEKILHLKLNQVHVVFEHTKEKVDILCGCELNKHGFKSVNFYGPSCSISLTLARHLVSDPEVSMLFRTYASSTHNGPPNFITQDWGFIHFPKSVNKYELKSTIMGIDLGAEKSTLAILQNNKIQVIPFDSSSEDLWTESVISFDEDKPIIGKEAVKKLETNPGSVIFDMKLVSSRQHRWNKQKQLTWPFDYNFKDCDEPRLVAMTSQGSQEFSLTEINKIFLDRMVEKMNEYENKLECEQSVKKAVFTVPHCFKFGYSPIFTISNIIKAAKLASIEVIDVIEETHADLLYYLSHEKYLQIIKSKMRIAIFDIGGANCVCKIYEISDKEQKRYGTCVGELHMRIIGRGSGRDIDDMIIKEIEELIPNELRNNLKLKTLEAAKKIKHHLSSEDSIKYDLSEIHFDLERSVEFTREWFEEKLEEYLKDRKLIYNELKQYSLPYQRNLRSQPELEKISSPPLMDVNIVFLTGGTCRIPFIQRWIKEIFPKANVEIEEHLETITATGAAIHALQVLTGEVEPYIKPTEQRKNNSIQNSEQSNYRTESFNQFPSEKECIHSKDFNLDEETSLNYDQTVITSSSETNEPKNKHQHKIAAETLEDVPAKKKFLPS